MSDFSMFSLFTAGLACLVPLTNAYTKPVGDSPKGNPISEPGLNSVVPAGQPYTITWDPTTTGTVTLVLLKGPAENAQPLYPIVEKTMNIGTYVWVPSDKLAPGQTGYGIQLIDDATGQYQYTTQFGISNPDYHGGSGDHSAGSYSSEAFSGFSSVSASTSASGYASASWSAYPTGGTGAAWPHHNGTVHPTGGWGHHNSTQPKPTGHVKPTWHHTTKAPSSSYAPNPTASQPVPTHTGAASSVTTSFFGLVAAAGIAVFAL